MERIGVIKLLADGLSYCQNSFKNIELDLLPEERIGQTDNFTYSLGPVKLNSAEKYNMERRAACPIKAYELDDYSRTYSTRDFIYGKVVYILKVIEYLQNVLKTVISINDSISEICKKSKEISKNKNLSKEDLNYQIIKCRISGYLDIIKDIRVKIKDLEISEYATYINRSYTELEGHAKLILSMNAVSDELTDACNDLYNGIALNKFSDLRAQKVSKNSCMAGFSLTADKLYTLLHVFSTNLLDEFSVYFTSDQFLNNPKKKALFVVPMSMYVKFNFQASGLCRNEIVSLENPADIAKTASNYKAFFSDLKKELNTLYKELREYKKELMEKEDQMEVEQLFQNFIHCYQGQTAENINELKSLTDDIVFREKFTELIETFRPELIENTKKGKDPWHNRTNSETSNKKTDNDICIYLCKIYQRCGFNLDKFPQIQFVRFLNLYQGVDYPDKSFSRIKRLYLAGKKTWSKDNQSVFQSLLDA